MTPVGSRFGTPGAVTPPSAEAPLLRLELKGRLGALFLFFGGEMGVSGTQPPERGEAWRVKLWFSMLGLGESLACFFFFFFFFFFSRVSMQNGLSCSFNTFRHPGKRESMRGVL